MEIAKNIRNQFVTKEIAILAKKYKFNHLCMAFIQKSESHPFIISTLGITNQLVLAVPTWQQLFDWFIEEHEMWGEIGFSHSNGKIIYNYYIVGMKTDSDGSAEGYDYLTKEEAREACLIRLFGELQLRINGLID